MKPPIVTVGAVERPDLSRLHPDLQQAVLDLCEGRLPSPESLQGLQDVLSLFGMTAPELISAVMRQRVDPAAERKRRAAGKRQTEADCFGETKRLRTAQLKAAGVPRPATVAEEDTAAAYGLEIETLRKRITRSKQKRR